MIGGLGRINGEAVMFIGQQKAVRPNSASTETLVCPTLKDIEKAPRLSMKMAEKFGLPVIALIDIALSYPGLEAEERGQGEAIARNLMEMAVMKVPIICIVIGEGASGGALGIGIGDRVYMMENTWYSVISPESVQYFREAGRIKSRLPKP
ncbi:MAG: carboxyl transferase domain-containing protein [Bacteroidia bacterium]